MNNYAITFNRMKWIVLTLLACIALWYLGPLQAVAGAISKEIEHVRYQPQSNFDSQRWKSGNLKYRYSVLDYVCSTVIKPGMSEQQVTNLLGAPDSRPPSVQTPDSTSYQYGVERPPSFFDSSSTFGDGLLIEFSPQRTVISAEKDLWST
jgi:hypothetical protein